MFQQLAQLLQRTLCKLKQAKAKIKAALKAATKNKFINPSGAVYYEKPKRFYTN